MPLIFARQPIFDQKNKLFGYELLYREAGETAYTCKDGDIATSNVMAASFLSMGVQELAAKKKGFINFTENMLLHQVATLFPKEDIVVEVLETVEATDDIVSACKSLKKDGYTLALDDFVFKPGYERLIELADIIKVDFMITKTPEERMGVVQRFGNGKIKFLAEKIETREEFSMALQMGYHYFQGYFFSKPVIVESKEIPASKLNQLMLIKALQTTDPKFNEISKIIEKDVSFAYEILKIANTAHYYRGNKIKSIQQATVLMGLDELMKWAYITILRKMGDNSQDEVVNLCAQRAKTLELLSQKIHLGFQKMEFFTLGIMSMLDVLTGLSMEKVIAQISVSDDVKEILIQKKTTSKMGISYQALLAYEKGEWNKVTELTYELNIQVDDLANAYIVAVLWMQTYGE